MPTLLAQANRSSTDTGTLDVAPGTTGRYTFMTNIAAADLADPTNWVAMWMAIVDPTVPGGWRFADGFVYQCGPKDDKSGVAPNGRNVGVEVNAADYAGRTVRGSVRCFNGNPLRSSKELAEGLPAAAPSKNIRIGIDYTVSP